MKMSVMCGYNSCCIVILLHVLIIAKASSTNRCPKTTGSAGNLRVFRHQCYQFIFQERNWDDAMHDCSTKGGNLVQVRNPATQDFIMGTLRSLGFHSHGLWLGATDEQSEGHWKWLTGDNVVWSNWQAGEGNSWMDDCMVLRFSDGGKWHDVSCDFGVFYEYSYICQYDLIAATTTVTSTSPSTTTTNQITTKEYITRTTQATKAPENITDRTTNTSSFPSSAVPTTTAKAETGMHTVIINNTHKETATRTTISTTTVSTTIPRTRNVTSSTRYQTESTTEGKNTSLAAVNVTSSEKVLFGQKHFQAGSGELNNNGRTRPIEGGDNGENSPVNSIVGSVVGGVAVVVLTFVMVFFIMRYRRKRIVAEFNKFDNKTYGVVYSRNGPVKNQERPLPPLAKVNDGFVADDPLYQSGNLEIVVSD